MRRESITCPVSQSPHPNEPVFQIRSSGERKSSSRSGSIPKVIDDSDVISRVQEATQSVMGRITGMSRITGGLANKLGSGILKF